MSRIFAERKQSGGIDLEAAEMGLRAVLHRAGAAALTDLLQFPDVYQPVLVDANIDKRAELRHVGHHALQHH